MEKVRKILSNLYDKTKYVTHIKKLKQALNNVLVYKEFQRVNKLNQNSQPKPFIDMNTDSKKKGRNKAEKD